jgi:hypothetical protein
MRVEERSMRFWQTVSRRFEPGFRRGEQARLELTASYRRLFSGQGGKGDAEAVLADLANYSGFYRVNEVGVSGEARAFTDGGRAVYGRIFRFLRLTDDELRALEEAARQEALITAREGAM